MSISDRSLFQNFLSANGPIVNCVETFDFTSGDTSVQSFAGTEPFTMSLAKYTLP